jgi:c-di-GMP-binding flagellar brake protein YcgR
MPEAQRRFPRIASHHSVMVTKLTDGSEERGLTNTIALGGCGVITSDSIGMGNTVELLIAIDPQNVIKALGRVVYERPLDDGRYEVGVEFVHMNDDAARHIARLFDPPQSRRAQTSHAQ